MEVSFGWSQEIESNEIQSGGWRKVNCVARESDDDLRKILTDWLSDRTLADAAVARMDSHWVFVHNIMQTECEYQVLSVALRFSGAESARAELNRVMVHRSRLISMITKMLESSDGESAVAADNEADALALDRGGS